MGNVADLDDVVCVWEHPSYDTCEAPVYNEDGVLNPQVRIKKENNKIRLSYSRKEGILVDNQPESDLITRILNLPLTTIGNISDNWSRKTEINKYLDSLSSVIKKSGCIPTASTEKYEEVDTERCVQYLSKIQSLVALASELIVEQNYKEQEFKGADRKKNPATVIKPDYDLMFDLTTRLLFSQYNMDECTFDNDFVLMPDLQKLITLPATPSQAFLNATCEIEELDLPPNIPVDEFIEDGCGFIAHKIMVNDSLDKSGIAVLYVAPDFPYYHTQLIDKCDYDDDDFSPIVNVSKEHYDEQRCNDVSSSSSEFKEFDNYMSFFFPEEVQLTTSSELTVRDALLLGVDPFSYAMRVGMCNSIDASDDSRNIIQLYYHVLHGIDESEPIAAINNVSWTSPRRDMIQFTDDSKPISFYTDRNEALRKCLVTVANYVLTQYANHIFSDCRSRYDMDRNEIVWDVNDFSQLMTIALIYQLQDHKEYRRCKNCGKYFRVLKGDKVICSLTCRAKK